MRRPSHKAFAPTADQRAAVLWAWRRYRFDRFKLPDGPYGIALLEAQRWGWVWCPRPGVACVTLSGRQAVGEPVPVEPEDAQEVGT